ncbi:recombinase family protein [Luteitalea sp.]
MPAPATTPRAFGYLRVSTDEQGRSGLSLEHQRRKAEGYAQLHDLTLADVVTDVASAKSLRREGLSSLLGRLKAGDVVIVAKLDRLTRSVRDLADVLDLFTRRGVSLVSVGEHLDTGSAAGRLVLNVMASVSQWEREAIAERTSDALQARKRRGLVAGGHAPYGFTADAEGRLQANADERRILARMAALKADGLSQRRIADVLNAEGHTTRKGTPWRFQYVARLLDDMNPTGAMSTAA